MKKKVRRAANNRLLFFGSISVFIILFFVASFFDFTIQVNKLNDEQKDIQSNIDILKDNEDNLKNEIVKLKDPDYLARYARENYMYSKDGEYIIKVNESDLKEEQKEVKRDNKVYIVLISLGISSLILLVIKKIFFWIFFCLL